MLQANSPIDPIVQILRLAYRRGLAIQQEQERNESSKPGTSRNGELAEHRQITAKESVANINLTNG